MRVIPVRNTSHHYSRKSFIVSGEQQLMFEGESGEEKKKKKREKKKKLNKVKAEMRKAEFPAAGEAVSSGILDGWMDGSFLADEDC